MSDMYREQIIELYKNPKNFGEIKFPTHKHTETNSSCGDELTINLIIKNRKIEDVKFNGSGCVMSMVSASLLTEKIKGMEIEDVKEIELKDILKLLKTKISPGRIKCISLPLVAVQNAIKN